MFPSTTQRSEETQVCPWLHCRRESQCSQPRHREEGGTGETSSPSPLPPSLPPSAPQDIPGLTTDTVPRRLGPKRVGKIRKLYNLSKVTELHTPFLHHTPPVSPLHTLTGRRRPTVRDSETPPPQGGETPEVQGPQDPATDHSSPTPAQTSPAGPEEEVGGEIEGRGCRVCQTVGTASEGCSRPAGSKEETVQQKIFHVQHVIGGVGVARLCRDICTDCE